MCACFHIKPFFLLNDISTPSVRAGSSQRNTSYVVIDCETKNKTTALNQGKASEMLAYLVREHNKTSQTTKIRKN